jgi:hypothetical protein
MIDEIIAYENGELNDLQTIELFGKLVANGTAWTLQGHYGRTAHRLIEWGALSFDGKVNYEFLDSVAFL